MTYALIGLFGLLVCIIGFVVAVYALTRRSVSHICCEEIDRLERKVQKVVFDLEMGSMSHEEATDELLKCFDEYRAKHKNNKKEN